MTDYRIRQAIDDWLCNTAINRMKFAEDASELVDLPSLLLKRIAERFSVSGSDAEKTINTILAERESHARRHQAPGPAPDAGAGRSSPATTSQPGQATGTA
jgi:hypothetical protein